MEFAQAFFSFFFFWQKFQLGFGSMSICQITKFSLSLSLTLSLSLSLSLPPSLSLS